MKTEVFFSLIAIFLSVGNLIYSYARRRYYDGYNEGVRDGIFFKYKIDDDENIEANGKD